MTRSSGESEYERPPNRGGKGWGVRAAVLWEKETLKKNGQRMSQQEMSAKPSSNTTRPARLEIDEYKGNDMQVDDEGMRGNEEREVMERMETKKRRNEASKAVESSTKRKMHEKGNNPSLERYVTCDVAFAGFACLITMDLIWTPITFILYYRPPAKKQRPSPASENHHPQRISGVLPNWERNCRTSTQPVSAPRRSESSCKSYLLVPTMLLLTNDFVFGYEVPHSQPSKYAIDSFRYLSIYTQQLLPTARVAALRTTLPMVQTRKKKKSTYRKTVRLLAPHRSACIQLLRLSSRSPVSLVLGTVDNY